MASPVESPAVQRSSSRSSPSVRKEKTGGEDPESDIVVISQDDTDKPPPHTKYKPFILGALALLILGWWISATVLKATRHRW